MEVNLGVTEKPSNLHKYNMSVHINIYKENEAYVNHLQEKVREEKGDQSLLLVGSNGQMLFDQEATRGKLTKALNSKKYYICI